MKAALKIAPVLTYFKVDEPVVLQCDASRYAIGAALLQRDLPVHYASRSMTETEQRYAQIEKELLAKVYGLKKFDTYVYMHPNVTVHTNHQPLEAICGRSLSQAPPKVHVSEDVRLHC